jgi:hypothetical protein
MATTTGKLVKKTIGRKGAIGPDTKHLRRDPVPWLLSSKDEAIVTHLKRDLLGESVDETKLWSLREPLRIIRAQKPDGSWTYPTKKAKPLNYDLYQTFTTLGILVAKYAFDKRHPAVENAAAYIFSCQSAEGDYRGIYGNQPAPTYTPALMEVLIQAGYLDHPSIARAFRWLLNTPQQDGGWAVAARTRDKRLVNDWYKVMAGPPIEPDRTRPSSHLVTGMVLRAFAAHPNYRHSAEARRAALLVKSRFFKADRYPDRGAPSFWTKFTYPFHFTDLITSLDSLGQMGFAADDPDVARAIDWFREEQKKDGSFALTMVRGISDKRLPFWLGLAIGRALRRFQK